MTKKKRQVRACKACGFGFDVVKLQCPSCKKWDVHVSAAGNNEDETVLLSEVDEKPLKRHSIGPYNKCFSFVQSTGESGLVTCQVALVGGVPGAGKSTLAIQLSDEVAHITKREVMYIAAEEAKEQIKDRALRLKLRHLDLIRIYPLGATSELGAIFQSRKPAVVVVDSLQGLTGDLEMQNDYCKTFKEYSVLVDIPFIVVSQVNKGEELAGLMALQHNVDTTMLFSVFDDKKKTRMLASHKNRFGPSQSVYLDMVETGLVISDYSEEDDPDWEIDELDE